MIVCFFFTPVSSNHHGMYIHTSVTTLLITSFICRDHPWFNMDLPEYLFPQRYDEIHEYDEGIIIEICHVRAYINIHASMHSTNVHPGHLCPPIILNPSIFPCHILTTCLQKFQVYREQVLDSLRANQANDQIVILYKLLYENKSTAGTDEALLPYELHTMTFIYT